MKQYTRPTLSPLATALLVLLVALLASTVLALALLWQRSSFDYPGASIITQHTNSRLLGQPYLQQSVSYRSTDAFPHIYTWYSTSFDLGTESHAQGPCILIENSHTWLVAHHHMGVTICDTQQQRMIFVQRTLSLR